MKKPDRNELEARDVIAQTEATLEQVAIKASAEIETARQSTEQHRIALARFKRTGEGLLPALAAQTFFSGFNALTMPPGMSDLGASADMHRANWFDGQKRRLETTARETYLRSNAREIATALEVVISARSVGREDWRSKIADEIASLDRGLLLNTTPLEDHPRVKGRMTEAENELLSADAQHAEAVRLVARLKTGNDADIVTLYGDAKGFVLSLPTHEAA